MRERKPRDQTFFDAESDVGKRLDDARAERGLSLRELAQRSGVDGGNLSRLRLGDRKADRTSVAAAFAIADALGVEARWLFLGEGPRTAVSTARLAEAKKLVDEAAKLLGD